MVTCDSLPRAKKKNVNGIDFGFREMIFAYFHSTCVNFWYRKSHLSCVKKKTGLLKSDVVLIPHLFRKDAVLSQNGKNKLIRNIKSVPISDVCT